MTTLTNLLSMMEAVARALGPELRERVTFVGGCTTALLLTDEFTKEGVRHTDDVDLIIHTTGFSEFHSLQQELQTRGFRLPTPTSGESAPICAMMLGDLRVDFMPDDPSILGFSNRWYPAATKTAMRYELTQDLYIKLVTPAYFLATKLEAYDGRGNGDLLNSRDMEDILTLVDGHDGLLEAVQQADLDVQTYLSEKISALLQERDFDYAVSNQARGDQSREDLIFERLERLTEN